MERPPLPGAGGRANANTTGSSKPNKRYTKRRKDRNTRAANSNSGNNGNGNSTSGNKSAPKGPPQTPQIKVTIRNIQNVEQYGTAQQVIDGLIRTLVEKANEKMPVDQKMELVLGNLEQLVREEQAVLQAKKEWNERENVEVLEATNDGNDSDGEQAQDEEKQQTETVVVAEETFASKVTPAMQNLKISENSNNTNNNSNNTNMSPSTTGIVTTVLYIIPPKKTRRRGEKPGCAYLLLMAPKIEAKIPSVPVPISENSVETVAPPVSTPVDAVDYSQEVTKRRLMLLHAIESMTNNAADDAKAKQDLAGCVVEESLNSKTWKTNYRPDRLEGTIEETADYTEFLERTEKEKEERSARPKPAPGGGAAASAGLTTEDGQPISELVLHLRAMHDEQSKRNKAKRKARDGGKKPKGKEQDGVGGGGGGSKQQQDAAKKKNIRKKKKPTKKPAPKVLKAAGGGGTGGGAPSTSGSAWNKG
jgi:hypothetical protein